MNFWNNKKVMITGGAGFIGHHLTDKLISLGAITTVGDNLSSGKAENILRVYKNNKLKYRKTNYGYIAEDNHKFLKIDFHEYKDTLKAFDRQEIIFHLAAHFGGRGFIDTHPANCCENFALNQNVIRASHEASCNRLFFASTACVYPSALQTKYGSTYLLKEDDAFKNDWGNADREYGWAKLMGELTLKAYRAQYGLKGSIARFVTAYGPWENDTHAIIALIRRAVNKQDPYVIWGSGKQDRDFTYVDDIVSGSLLACEKITNAQAVNLGTSKRYTLTETVNLIFDILQWHPNKIIYDKTKPEGVKTRALDIKKAKKILQWQPKYELREGIQKTFEWFIKYNPKPVETIE